MFNGIKAYDGKLEIFYKCINEIQFSFMNSDNESDCLYLWLLVALIKAIFKNNPYFNCYFALIA